MAILKLKKPLTIEGVEKKEISYDFESVKPIQYINLVKREKKKDPTITVPEVNMDVQLGYFAIASGIPVSDLKRVDSIQDFISITSLARDFLLNTSEETEEETNI